VSPPRHGREIKTLAEARRAFAAKRSPKLLAAAVALLAAVRVALGGASWRDAVAVAAMLLVYPLGEWAIHVYLLHLRPFRLRGRRVELPTARAHREHHEQPNDLGLILLAPLEVALLLLVAVPLVVGAGGLLIGLAAGTVPLAPLATAALTAAVLIGIYEWTHFLIHTAYRPRSRYYRSIWRSHRLHHFKNEHYWHGITTNVSDRLLGTYPDQRSVRRSRTARTLAP
jgi:sterol desaturase/sphingolipid hydroxylase (fatty acid hydroxylase superfamily)